MAFIVFQMVRLMNKAERHESAEEPAPPALPEDVLLLRENAMP